MLRKASALKSCSILEIRKQVITNKTFENKVPPAYILFLLLLLPPSTDFQKHLHGSPQETERETAFPHLHKMAAASPAPVPPQPSCPTWGPSSTPGGWPVREQWQVGRGLQATMGPPAALSSLGLDPCCGMAAEPCYSAGSLGVQLPAPAFAGAELLAVTGHCGQTLAGPRAGRGGRSCCVPLKPAPTPFLWILSLFLWFNVPNA